MQKIIQTDNFQLTENERKEILHEIEHYEDSRAASIEALKIVQKYRGWVCDGAIDAISNVLGISSADVEGVATFYSQIFREPVGRHIIRVCDSMTCYISGYESVLNSIKNKLNIDVGQTTQDKRFTLLPVCCLGNCDKAPSMMIDDDTYSKVDVGKISELLEVYQ